MNCKNVIKYLEDWAPKEIAWEKDNVGLQVGSYNRILKNILICLEVTDKVVKQAIKKNCNLIISHHPLLFRPVKKIDLDNNRDSKLLEEIIKNDITVYSSHTNLDFTKDGVSFQLAKKLKLNKISFLQNLSSNLSKIAVFIPDTHLEEVAYAMHSAGGGISGEYSNCSFRTTGTGTFKGSEKSNPVKGEKLKLEKVSETKLEMIVNNFYLKKVISAMLSSHPYEEVAYDVYPLTNENTGYGMGAIGELKSELSTKEFLKHISSSLSINNFKFTKGNRNKIRKVAVCGGSGSELLETAINRNADAFITADIKYHTFHDAAEHILIVDAGHYETERFIIDEIAKRVSQIVNKANKVYKYSGSTNPIVFYNN